MKNLIGAIDNKGYDMNRIRILMTLGAVAIATTVPAWELLENAKAGDDAALKEVTLEYMILTRANVPNAPAEILTRHIEYDGISRERMVKVLDEMFRENLSVIGTESEAKPSRWYARTALQMLRELPGEDTLTLFREYAELGKDKELYTGEHVSDVATKVYNRTLKILQEQANPTNDVEQIRAFVTGIEIRETEDTSLLEKTVAPIAPPPNTVAPEKNEPKKTEEKSSPLWLWGVCVIVGVVACALAWRVKHGAK